MYNRFLNVSRYSERGDSHHRAAGYALTQILPRRAVPIRTTVSPQTYADSVSILSAALTSLSHALSAPSACSTLKPISVNVAMRESTI